MQRPLAVFALLLTAAPVRARGMSALMFDKNTTPATSGAAADCLENCGLLSSTGEEGIPSAPPQAALQDAASAPAPSSAPAPRRASAAVTPRDHARARNGAFVPRDPAAQRYYEGETKDRLSDAVADRPARRETRKAEKLWDSVGKPLDMSAAQVAKTPGLDDADAAASAEYERRILGLSAARPAKGETLSDAPNSGLPASTALAAPGAAAGASGELFVDVELAASEQAGLKDAVAGLSSVSGFRADPRFPPQSAELPSPNAAARAATSLRGWLPADRLGAAVAAPGVLRVQVDRGGPRPESASSAVTTLLVGLRIPSQASAGETFQRAIAELSSSARFHWTRTVGFQAIPNSHDVALVVVGEVPVTRIPKLLEHPAVLKIAPAPLDSAAPEPPAPGSSRLADFFAYARAKAPLLIALTLLLLLPSVGGALLKLGQTFVPYDR